MNEVARSICPRSGIGFRALTVKACFFQPEELTKIIVKMTGSTGYARPERCVEPERPMAHEFGDHLKMARSCPEVDDIEQWRVGQPQLNGVAELAPNPSRCRNT